LSEAADEVTGDASVVFSLDDDRALDIEVAGAKAAWLARGRRSGLPVLPGFVLSTDSSRPYVSLGLDALASGSGAARMAIINAPPPTAVAALEEATADWSEPIVARSSSTLEGSGAWSGAFTSYLDLRHGELGVGVLGCWASVFAPSTLERFRAADVDVGASRIAVLVQPAIHPTFGGTARLVDDIVHVEAVEGPPGPLVQGWSPGAAAKVGRADDISGRAALELLGPTLLGEIAHLMRMANTTTGANGCEWGATTAGLVVFQLTRSVTERSPLVMGLPRELSSDDAVRVAALVRRYPGPLGEALVLPWIIGGGPGVGQHAVGRGPKSGDLLAAATDAAAQLTAEVWGTSAAEAMGRASDALRELRGSRPAGALTRLASLHPPDPERASKLLGLIDALATELVDRGLITDPGTVWQIDPRDLARAIAGDRMTRRDRVGFDRWEPFTAGVVMATGRTVRGRPAGPGIGAGRMCAVLDTDDLQAFRPRDVLVSTHPVPNLAPLLWDASAVVTVGGSAGAHLFESARAVGVPAVCGLRIEEIIGGDLADLDEDFVLAVDGFEGDVSAARW